MKQDLLWSEIRFPLRRSQEEVLHSHPCHGNEGLNRSGWYPCIEEVRQMHQASRYRHHHRNRHPTKERLIRHECSMLDFISKRMPYRRRRSTARGRWCGVGVCHTGRRDLAPKGIDIRRECVGLDVRKIREGVLSFMPRSSTCYFAQPIHGTLTWYGALLCGRDEKWNG